MGCPISMADRLLGGNEASYYALNHDDFVLKGAKAYLQEF